MVDRYPPEILGEDDDNGTMVESLEELSEAVIGHKIVNFDINTSTVNRWGQRERASAITLDNGKRVFLINSSDCCAFTELEDFLLHADKIDHIITGVGTTDGFTTWHIYADFGDILELKVAWSPGNPFWYGYGFTIQVENIN